MRPCSTKRGYARLRCTSSRRRQSRFISSVATGGASFRAKSSGTTRPLRRREVGLLLAASLLLRRLPLRPAEPPASLVLRPARERARLDGNAAPRIRLALGLGRVEVVGAALPLLGLAR